MLAKRGREGREGVFVAASKASDTSQWHTIVR